MKFGAMVRRVLGIAVLAAISSDPARASLYYFPVFGNADVDGSGDLSASEFNTTLGSDLSPKAQAKSFRRADLNRNGSIQLNEFLIFARVIRPENALERWFYLADVSIDGALSFDEYQSRFKAKVSLVNIRRDYLRADRDESGGVTLLEYSNFRRGLTPPSRFTVFELADIDADGQLSVTEFAHAYSQSTSQAAIAKRFDLLDDNNDGLLTTSEWNPGVIR